MKRELPWTVTQVVLGICAAVMLVTAPRANAQPADPANNASAPEKAFIANGGGDFGPSPFNLPEDAGAERAYNEFFAGMANWGRFEIVADPAHADWIFEITVHNEPVCENRHDQRVLVNLPSMEVAMMDTKTWGIRKTFIQRIQPVSLLPLRTPDHNFDAAIIALIDGIKAEIGVPASKTSLARKDPIAPVPPKIGSATKVFVRDLSPIDPSQDKYSGGQTEAYKQFLTALQGSWGRYQLTFSAKEADLVLDLSLIMQPACARTGIPELSLAIQDARSQVRLWGIVIQVDPAIFTGNARKNFALGVAELVRDLRFVAERPTWTADATVPATGEALIPATMRPEVPAWAATPARIGTQASTAAPLPVTVSLAANVVKSGAEVRVDVTLKNTSKMNFDFIYAGGDPLRCLVAVHDASGNPAAETEQGRALQARHAGWNGPPMRYSLAPGETQTRACTVSDVYDLTHPGKYAIEAQQLDGSPVKSNAVTVTVVP
jgi:hypothetical protein